VEVEGEEDADEDAEDEEKPIDADKDIGAQDKLYC
jgi:hypothetical protein